MRTDYIGNETIIYHDNGLIEHRYEDPKPKQQEADEANSTLFIELFLAPFSLLGHALAFLLFGRARTVSASRLLLLFFVVMFLVPVGGLLAYGFYLHPHKMAVALPAFWHFIVAHYL